MRCTTRRAIALGTFVAASRSIAGEAFLAARSFLPAAPRRSSTDKLRLAAGEPQPTTTAFRPGACRRRHAIARRASVIQEHPPLTPTPSARGVTAAWGASADTRGVGHRRPRVWATSCSMSSDPYGGEIVNPLSRDDPERARLNNFITILAGTPREEWKPAILDEYLSSLLKGNLYRQAMAERLAKVRSGDERETLTRVDAFLTGFLSQERRRASRKKVSLILSAATAGAMALDECVQTLGEEDLLDSDLTDYVASLVSAEANRCTQSTLLSVLKMVRDRIQAELKTGARPEIRTLAQALQFTDPNERKNFIQHTFTKLEDLDDFVKFVEEGIEYMGNDFGFALRSNMPQENFDKMKAVYADAAAIRRSYLQ